MAKCKVFYGQNQIAEIEVSDATIASDSLTLHIPYDTGLIDDDPDSLGFGRRMFGAFVLGIIRPGHPKAWLDETVLLSGHPTLSAPKLGAVWVEDDEDFVTANNRAAMAGLDRWRAETEAQK